MFSRSLSCASVPWNATKLVPLPLSTITPMVPVPSVSVPSVTDSVIVSLPALPSTSLTESPLFFRLRLTCSVAL